MDKQLDSTAKNYRIGFKQKYNMAKFINLLVMLINFIIAIASVIITTSYQQFKSLFVFISFFWGLISIYLNKYVSSQKKIAADMQELYDIYIFNINKNKKIMYPKTSKYTIRKHNQVIKDRYYEIDEEHLCNDNILDIQKDNITYDKAMRQKYHLVNNVYLVIYVLIMIFISIKKALDMFDLIVVIVVPSINILNYFIKNNINLKNEIIQIVDATNDISNSINLLKEMTEEEKIREIRNYQDFIYLKRRNWTMIPNYIYKLCSIFSKYNHEIKEENKNEEANKNLQEEAFEIENRLGILNFLNKYGRAEIVGSVANNLIVHKDIDVHLLTEEDIYVIKEKVVIYLNSICSINDIIIEDYKNDKQAVCVTIKKFKGWNTEIWICGCEEYVGFDMKEKLHNNLDGNKRKIIMDLKNYYYSKGALHGEMSTMIYNGVLYGHVKNVDDFKRYIIEKL